MDSGPESPVKVRDVPKDRQSLPQRLSARNVSKVFMPDSPHELETLTNAAALATEFTLAGAAYPALHHSKDRPIAAFLLQLLLGTGPFFYGCAADFGGFRG